jgi:dihydrofolate reductase
MRKLTVAAFISLDGVIQGPGGPEEDTTGGFKHGGWVFPFADAAFGEVMGGVFSDPYDLLLGRKTYDIFAPYWGARRDDGGIGEAFTAVNKYVASRDPGFQADWDNSHILQGDAVEAVRRLKSEPGRNLLTQGSADFIQSLLKSDVVDEIFLLTMPVILGPGKRLFEGEAQAFGLKLVSTRATPAGVVVSRYARDGEVKTGSFED